MEKNWSDSPENHAVRLQVPPVKVAIEDKVVGPRSWNLESEVGDFIVRRKDGLFAYQLAVVVDDIFQGVDHIVRGQDLLDSTPRQLAIYKALGEAAPVYMHIPIATDNSGAKLSKQAHARPVPLSNASETLRNVLTDLGQPSVAPGSVKEVLRKATQNWTRSGIPSIHDFKAPHRFLDE